jgi:prepilin-type processing-associated H-X9-DG protein
MKKTRLWEWIIALTIIVVLAALLLPALARSREAARRSSCQNNLKQMGLIIRMYANEFAMMYPPPSPIPGNWTFDANVIYPEYLTDPSVLRCPSSPYHNLADFTLKDNFEHPGAQIGTFHTDCVSSMFYIYTGYEILYDEQAQALVDTRNMLPDGYFGTTDIAIPATGRTIDKPADPNNPSAGALYLSRLPVVWDRIGSEGKETNHVPAGANVLYADGHVEFRRYSYYNTPEEFPVTWVSAAVFGDSIPALSRDCYE